MDTEHFISFVRDLYKVKTGVIPLHAPVFNGNEKHYLIDTIDSTFVSSVGKYVDAVEGFMAQYTATKKAVAMVNGTAALQIALQLAGVKPGDEVITQALTFVATANAIAYNQAHPVFIDVDLDTMGLSPTALQRFLEECAEKREDGCFNKKTNRRIAACMPMHTFGLMCRIQEIVSICNDWGISVVEDAAEALGSKSKDVSAGSFGKVGAFSFNGNKIVTAGGGGVLVTNAEELGNTAKHLTTTAKKAHPWEYVHDVTGYNFRMPNVNAALLLAQLEKLEEYRARKAEVYNQYAKALQHNPYMSLVEIPESTSQWNYWLIPVKLSGKEERDAFLEQTNKAGVMTRPVWQLMYRLPMYKHCFRDDQINAELLEEQVVNIPSSVRLTH